MLLPGKYTTREGHRVIIDYGKGPDPHPLRGFLVPLDNQPETWSPTGKYFYDSDNNHRNDLITAGWDDGQPIARPETVESTSPSPANLSDVLPAILALVSDHHAMIAAANSDHHDIIFALLQKVSDPKKKLINE